MTEIYKTKNYVKGVDSELLFTLFTILITREHSDGSGFKTNKRKGHIIVELIASGWRPKLK